MDECVVKRAARIAQDVQEEGAATRRLAFLVFDSHEGIALAGSRSAGFRPRRMLFQSGPAALDLELRTSKREGPPALTGHIRADALMAGGSLTLRSERGEYQTTIDEQGFFELPTLRAGDYALRADLGREILEVPSLSV